MLPEYDIVIVGSGLGGLLCAAILGKEGYRVCVLEKNNVAGKTWLIFNVSVPVLLKLPVPVTMDPVL